MKILWLKWNDPIAPLVLDNEEKLFHDDDDMEMQAMHDSLYGQDDIKWTPTSEFKNKLGPCVVGPQGIIPLHESNIPSKLYNFWVGHTDFDLSASGLANKISQVPGVETMDCFTRYRFRIAIGKAFNQADVKKAIEASIQTVSPSMPAPTNVPTSNTVVGLDAIKQLLTKRYAFWAIWVMPNGKYESVGGATAEEVVSKGQGFASQAKEVVKSWV